MRFPRLIGAPDDATARIAALRLVVVGAGAVGARIVDHLARLGVAAITVIDRGVFKPTSLFTQPVTPDDIGGSKATRIAGRARRLAPRTRMTAIARPVQALDPDAFHDADAVFLATDNLEAEIDVGQRCLRLGRPLVQASVHGESLTAQVRIFGNAPLAACPACGFTREEWSHVDRGTRFACDPSVDPTDAYARSTAETPPDANRPLDVPTLSPSALCSLASDLAVLELLRRVLALGAPLEDGVLTYGGYTHTTSVTSLTRNPACPCDHRPVEVVGVDGELAAHTLAALIARAGSRGLTDVNAVSLAGCPFVELARCACGESTHPCSFVARGEDVGRCGSCGGGLHVEPYFSHDPVPLNVVASVRDRTLASLTGRPPRIVTLWGDAAGIIFREVERG